MAASDWIAWTGGECPLEPGTVHDRKYADGQKVFGVRCEATAFMRRAIWCHDGVGEDIIAYRVVQA